MRISPLSAPASRTSTSYCRWDRPACSFSCCSIRRPTSAPAARKACQARICRASSHSVACRAAADGAVSVTAPVYQGLFKFELRRTLSLMSSNLNLPVASVRTRVHVPLRFGDGFRTEADLVTFEGLADGREHVAVALGSVAPG